MQTHEAAQHTSATVQNPAVCVALCVDDYGLHEGVNRAVGELAALGRVQATSAMVGGAAWASGLALLRQLDPAQVQVGLHLDLTECALNPALRLPLGRCIAQAYLRRFDTAALAREIAQQLDRFEQGLGRPPAYVDGHQHIHQLPGARAALLHVLHQRYGTQAPWVRKALVRREFPGGLRVELQEHDAVAFWGGETGSALVNSQGEVFEANVGDVEQEGLPRLTGPQGSSAEVLQMHGVLQPLFEPLGMAVDALELTGRGGWRATLDTGAALELGGGTQQEVVQRTQRFISTLTGVAAQYQRRADALESADLRHAGGYALRLRGVTTVTAEAAAKK